MIWIYSSFKPDQNIKIIPNSIPLFLHLQIRHAREMSLGSKPQAHHIALKAKSQRNAFLQEGYKISHIFLTLGYSLWSFITRHIDNMEDNSPFGNQGILPETGKNTNFTKWVKFRPRKRIQTYSASLMAIATQFHSFVLFLWQILLHRRVGVLGKITFHWRGKKRKRAHVR